MNRKCLRSSTFSSDFDIQGGMEQFIEKGDFANQDLLNRYKLKSMMVDTKKLTKILKSKESKRKREEKLREKKKKNTSNLPTSLSLSERIAMQTPRPAHVEFISKKFRDFEAILIREEEEFTK